MIYFLVLLFASLTLSLAISVVHESCLCLFRFVVDSVAVVTSIEHYALCSATIIYKLKVISHVNLNN